MHAETHKRFGLNERRLKPICDVVEPWFRANKRDLPWRKNKTPYRVWLSEIMLQQTQVQVVTEYYQRFIATFPTILDLSKAKEQDVLSLWSGLGYYSRGRNLHKCAKQIVDRYKGQFPDQFDELIQLPGIGSYTAGAISAFAFDKPAPVVDGNIARVLARLLNDPTPVNTPKGKKHFEAISANMVSFSNSPGDLQEGLMEIGAVICKRSAPRCNICPIKTHCAIANLDRLKIETLPKKNQKSAAHKTDFGLPFDLGPKWRLSCAPK